MFESSFEKHLANRHLGPNNRDCHERAVRAQNLRLIATERAASILKQQGHGYPTRSEGQTHIEHYDEVLAYGDLLAKYTLLEMKKV